MNYVFIKIGISIAPQYGLVGVALATLITRYGNMTALGILAKKKLNIKTSASSISKPLITLVIMFAFLFIVDYFVYLNIFSGIAMIISAALVYLLTMFLIKGIKKEDFKLLRILKT